MTGFKNFEYTDDNRKCAVKAEEYPSNLDPLYSKVDINKGQDAYFVACINNFDSPTTLYEIYKIVGRLSPDTNSVVATKINPQLKKNAGLVKKIIGEYRTILEFRIEELKNFIEE